MDAKLLVSIFVTVGMAVFGYFVHSLDRSIAKLEQALRDHDEADDRRFEKVDAKLADLHKETVDKRHAFRNEIMAFVGQETASLKEYIRALRERQG